MAALANGHSAVNVQKFNGTMIEFQDIGRSRSVGGGGGRWMMLAKYTQNISVLFKSRANNRRSNFLVSLFHNSIYTQSLFFFAAMQF